MTEEILSGTAGSVAVRSALAGSGTVVGEISEWSLDLSHSPVETTAFGQEWTNVIAGLRAAAGSFSGNSDFDDAGQLALQAAYDAGATIRVGLWLSPLQRFEATALLAGISDGVTVDGADTTLWDFETVGQITYELPRLWLLEDAATVLYENGDMAYLTF